MQLYRFIPESLYFVLNFIATSYFYKVVFYATLCEKYSIRISNYGAATLTAFVGDEYSASPLWLWGHKLA